MPAVLPTSSEGLFDDAGLFPPARRPMAEALTTHARARAGPQGPYVGPFLCPVRRLDELDACVAGGVPVPSRLGVVVYAGDEAAAERALARPEVVQVEAPAEVELPSAACQRLCYLELAAGADPTAAVDEVVARGARVKVRCGGPAPDTVPTAGWLAAVLHRATRVGSKVKATAGLHHPFRTEPSEHGFVNLLAAASAAVQGSDVEELTALLAAPATERAMLLAQVDRRGRDLLASIGTCSLDEPLDAMVELGLGG